MSRSLYFLAIIPPREIAEEVKAFKLQAKNLFQSKHALKSPAHITLVPPFWMDPEQKSELIEFLQVWSKKQNLLSLKLDGFDCFSPRVIFIKNKPSVELTNLQDNLFKATQRFHRKRPIAQRPFHPHMTVAFKDLKRPEFYEAWEYFRTIPFHREIVVDRIFLLIHEQSQWKMHDHFTFNEKTI